MPAAATQGTSATERPRFRQDLVAELVEDEGHRFIDVADPDSGTIFRFFEVEFSLACAMDGQRDVAGIVSWAKEELGLMPSVNEVRTVVATLQDLGYLDSTAAPAVTAPAAIEAAKQPEPVRPAAVAAAAAAPQAIQAAKSSGATAAAKGATLSGPAITARPAAADRDLAAGVVVGARSTGTPVEDVELGQAGATASAPVAAMPKAADIALGAPGATATAKAPKIPVEDIALGQAGAKDVSLDLADHIAVGKDDVKEAVRQSKVMGAVDAPKDLLEAVEEKPTAPVTRTTSPGVAPAPSSVATPAVATPAQATPAVATPAVATPAVATPAVATPAQATPAAAKAEPAAQTGGKKGKKDKGRVTQPGAATAPAAKAESASSPAESPKVDQKADTKKTEPKPGDKQAEPTKSDTKGATTSTGVDKKSAAVAAGRGTEQKKATVPPAPEPAKTSKALIFLLLLAVLGGGGYLLWRYVLNKPTATTVGTAPVTPVPEVPVTPPTPPPPAPPKAQMALSAPATTQLVATTAGKLESVVADGTAVKPGEVVATLRGYKAFDSRLAAAAAALKKQQDKVVASAALLEKATAEADPKLADFQKRDADAKAKLAEVEAALEAIEAERAPLAILAPGAGTVKAIAKVGADVTTETAVAELQRAPVPTVTFALTPPGATYEPGTPQTIMAGSQLVTCTVEASTAEALTLACPESDATKAGADVVFAPTKQ